MKSLIALIALVLFGGGLAACGASSNGTNPTSHASVTGATRGTTDSVPVSGSDGLKGDEDDDDLPGGETGSNANDDDNDFDNDRTGNEGKGYYDEDDGTIEAYGHPASAEEARPLTVLVERYRAAAIADDGVKACTMLDTTLLATLPESYAKQQGPAYLRGAKDCETIMSRVFMHSPSAPNNLLHVVAVRVARGQGYVLLGSKTLPASYVPVKREEGRWRIAGLLVAPLP